MYKFHCMIVIEVKGTVTNLNKSRYFKFHIIMKRLDTGCHTWHTYLYVIIFGCLFDSYNQTVRPARGLSSMIQPPCISSVSRWVRFPRIASFRLMLDGLWLHLLPAFTLIDSHLLTLGWSGSGAVASRRCRDWQLRAAVRTCVSSRRPQTSTPDVGTLQRVHQAGQIVTSTGRTDQHLHCRSVRAQGPSYLHLNLNAPTLVFRLSFASSFPVFNSFICVSK